MKFVRSVNLDIPLHGKSNFIVHGVLLRFSLYACFCSQNSMLIFRINFRPNISRPFFQNHYIHHISIVFRILNESYKVNF
jgi:hypothetical protein